MEVIKKDTKFISNGKIVKVKANTVNTCSTDINLNRSTYNESNDCSVRAIQYAYGLSYDEAHTYAKINWNRKNNEGVFFDDSIKNLYLNNIKLNNKKTKKIFSNILHSISFDQKFMFHLYKEHNISKENNIANKLHLSKSKITLKRILRNFKKGTYLITIKSHVFTLKDGIIYGNYDDGIRTSVAIKEIYQIN